MSDARSSLTIDEIPTERSAVIVLAVSGELDLATITLLKEAVSTKLAPGAHVVLDLAEMSFCDSTGLGAFVGLLRQARAAGAALSLAAPRRRINDLLQLSGIDQVITVYPTRGAAESADLSADA